MTDLSIFTNKELAKRAEWLTKCAETRKGDKAANDLAAAAEACRTELERRNAETGE